MAGSPSWPAKLSLPGVEHAHPGAATTPKSGTRLMTCRRLLEIGVRRLHSFSTVARLISSEFRTLPTP
jgi:hypothetical protein